MRLRTRIFLMAIIIVGLCAAIILGINTKVITLPGKTEYITQTKTKVVEVEKPVPVPVVKKETRIVTTKAPVDPAANRAALLKLCRKAAYRNTRQCSRLRKSGAR